ncbi:DDE-type integrase/transposase/recombinase [Mesorhizobium sp. M1405]
MDVSDAKRLKALEDENAKLKKLLADQMLEASALRELLSKNGRASRQARSRSASAGRHGPVGASGLFLRLCGSQDDPLPVPASARDGRLRDLANERRRFGYRRLFILLRRAGEASGVNRIYRLYREEGLTVRKRRARRRAVGTRAPILVEAKLNARWSMDFVHDQFACGRRFRVLNIVDDVTRECLAAIPDTSISGRRVARELTELIAQRGKSGMIVSGHGTEFTSNAILAWSKDYRIEWHYIAPGKPMQNGYVESFNGRMRRPRPKRHRRMAGGRLQHRQAAFLARLPDPGGIRRDHHRNRLRRCADRRLSASAGCFTRAKRCNRNGRGSNSHWMTVQWQVTSTRPCHAIQSETRSQKSNVN